jgi:hypothetical protein
MATLQLCVTVTACMVIHFKVQCGLRSSCAVSAPRCALCVMQWRTYARVDASTARARATHIYICIRLVTTGRSIRVPRMTCMHANNEFSRGPKLGVMRGRPRGATMPNEVGCAGGSREHLVYWHKIGHISRKMGSDFDPFRPVLHVSR